MPKLTTEMTIEDLHTLACKIVDHWTVTIAEDRYTGAYSGGKWIALRGAPHDLPKGPWADNTACQEFWKSTSRWQIGRGDTMRDALEDLIKRNSK